MPTLSVTRSYSDGDALTEADLDAIKATLEDFFNVTKLDDDNFQNSGITGSTKLINSSVTTTILGTDSVTTDKIVDDAVTTAKIANLNVNNAKIIDAAVTPAKTATIFGKQTEGMVSMFHSYNSVLTIPRGTMVCNGDVINEANYNTTHGAGTYTTDGIASSNLLNKYLPSMTDKYVVGKATTTQDGTAPITTVGNSGSTIDWSHTHTFADHTHDALVAGVANTAIATGTTMVEQTTAASGTMSSDTVGSTTQDINPEAIPFLFIMKVI